MTFSQIFYLILSFIFLLIISYGYQFLVKAVSSFKGKEYSKAIDCLVAFSLCIAITAYVLINSIGIIELQPFIAAYAISKIFNVCIQLLYNQYYLAKRENYKDTLSRFTLSVLNFLLKDKPEEIKPNKPVYFFFIIQFTLFSVIWIVLFFCDLNTSMSTGGNILFFEIIYWIIMISLISKKVQLLSKK